MVLIMALVGTVITSCSNADEPLSEPTPNDEGTVYEVKLNFDGDIPNFTESEEPISRADESTPKRVYGINVWCMKTDGTETLYKNYAYGLFDNKEDMVISLLGGYKYRFECYMVEDDEEELYISSSNYTGKYPFNGCKIENKFEIGGSYSSGFNFDSNKITTVKSYDKGTSSQTTSYQEKPVIGIFYGILPEYTPSQNSIATIPIYKLGYYGLRIVVTGVPDGSLYVSPSHTDCIFYNYRGINYSPSYDYSYDYWRQTFTEAGSIERTFTGGFYRALYSGGGNLYYRDSWLSDMQNYSTNTSVSFTWTRANGYIQSFSKNVTLKRNVMTVLTVNLTGGAGEVSLGFEEHSEDMSTEDDTIDYDGGNMNDTPVNPEE